MEKKNINWGELGFSYQQTEKRFVANFKDGAWDEGALTEDATITLNECAGVFQYAQTCFEGLKAYTTENGDFDKDQTAEELLRYLDRLLDTYFDTDTGEEE